MATSKESIAGRVRARKTISLGVASDGGGTQVLLAAVAGESILVEGIQIKNGAGGSCSVYHGTEGSTTTLSNASGMTPMDKIGVLCPLATALNAHATTANAVVTVIYVMVQ